MAVAWFQEFEFEDRSTTNYDAVSERLGLDANPAVGPDRAHRGVRR